MFELFSQKYAPNIVLPDNAEQCIKLAALDLRRNLLDISGKTEGFDMVTKPQNKAITVAVDPHSAPNRIEGYVIEVNDNGVAITGSDPLGAVYGIYTFATIILGIDPLYHFSDLFPETKQSLTLENTRMESTESPCRFRGWFINDEDFLTGYSKCGVKRNITYNAAFFKDIISLEMMDKIYETALRLGFNMIIPCSYIDILNPYEESIVALAAGRGLYVSQHHQEAVGVAHFAAENYMRKHYPDKAVSYIQNPEEMKEIWRVYIEKWAKYEPHVIWQLGLRGKGDNAIWRTDKTLSSSDERKGAIISSAIADQYNIVAETVGHTDFISTATLWLEGAALYDKGYLKMPESTITVFSDIGDTQLFGGDFYKVARKPNAKYGIYYHAGFFVEGPHYCEGLDPRKMVYCYCDAEKYDSLHLSILNTGNIRELCSSLRLNAAILQGSPAKFSLDDYYSTVYPALYGDIANEIIDFEKRYFDSIGDLGDGIGKEIIDYTDFHYHSLPDLKFPYYPLADGTIIRLGSAVIGFDRRGDGAWKPCVENQDHFNYAYKELKACVEKFSALHSDIDKFQEKVPTSLRENYRFTYWLRVKTMLLLCRWAVCCFELAKAEDAIKNKRNGAAYLQEIIDLRKGFSLGKWQGWYDCDQRLDLNKKLEQMLSLRFT